ncbi:MAG: phosphatidylserine decarboxylase family protein [Bacteroidota bacterium]
MKIHKEGYKILLGVAIFLVALNYSVTNFTSVPEVVSNILLIASIIFYGLVLQFFRDPKITPETGDKKVIAPADGKVVVIEQAEEGEFLNEKRIQISIFMSPLNVHVNRNPVSGILKYFKYHPGKYLVAWHPKSSTENERTTLVYELKNGTQILIRQIAGAVARRIKWYVKEGQPLQQGNEFGFIRFGSRVDVFVPLDAKILVTHDQKTKGGKTVLAELS